MKRFSLPLIAIVFFCSLSYSQEKNNNTLLWRIDGKTTDTPSYLFGTIHLPQKKFVNYSDSVYAAIQNTSVFYNELDFLNQSIFGDTALMTFFMEKKKHADSIQKTEGWKRLIDKINRNYNTHLDYDNPDQFLDFSQGLLKSVYEPEEGVQLPDMMLATHAMMLGKKTGGLETYQLQFSMLYDVLDARLKDTTMELEDEVKLMEGLKKFYINEQTDSITRIVEKINPTYREIVFDNRNRTMADSIGKHITEKSCFFAIGAGHLGGKLGVIELLRKKGSSVTPVHSTNKISILIVNDMLKMSGDARKKKEKMFESLLDEGIRDEGVKIDVVPEPPPQPPPNPPKIEMKKAPVTKPAPVKQKPKKKP